MNPTRRQVLKGAAILGTIAAVPALAGGGKGPAPSHLTDKYATWLGYDPGRGDDLGCVVTARCNGLNGMEITGIWYEEAADIPPVTLAGMRPICP